ncbi:homeodomain-interacting protein kinase 1-like isoform X1 [Arapaima gigas]
MDNAGQPLNACGKAKKGSAHQPCSVGASGSNRHHQAAPSRSQPLNLSQVQPSVTSSQDRAAGGSLRRQPSYHAAAVSSHAPYSLQEAPVFSSAPGIYAYPASAALASVSQAVDQLHGSSTSSSSSSAAASSARHVGGPYSSASFGLLPKGGGVGRAQYQQQFPGQPYSRSGGGQGTYQLGHRKLGQYPYL